MPESAAKILEFGFLGLSFLMMYLGYTSLNKVLNQPNPSRGTLSACKFFLVVSLIFMMVAGPLQFGMVWLNSMVEHRVVTLYIVSPTNKWEKEFGDVTIIHSNHPAKSLIGGTTIAEEFDDKEQVLIDVNSVVDFIRELRLQAQKNLEVAKAKSGQVLPDERKALEGG